jgi:enoyl-CoA hydratase/carnithine racemase
LPQIVGLGIAKEWAMTGRRVGADEEHRRGRANHVFPADRLLAEALAFARELANRTPLSLALAKVALDPEPPAADGIVGVYHMLASQACHDDPMYAEQAGSYAKKKRDAKA